MVWDIAETKAFSKEFKIFKKNKELLTALDKKLQRLRNDPEGVGGNLSGSLSGHKSTRLIGKLRLVFKIVPSQNTVYLIGIDHRKHDYLNFEV